MKERNIRIIYLHGFASAGNGTKAQALRQRFGADKVISPDLPIDPRDVQRLVDGLIRATPERPIVLVGTSLGGFYAAWFSQRWKLPCVLVNPSTAPSETVGRRIGWHANFATGEPFEVKAEFGPVWKAMEAEVAANQEGALVSVFLAQDDDVLPYEIAFASTPPDAFKSITPDGGHRYEGYWGAVVERVARVAERFGCGAK